jgi:16S rRNA (cytosine1402-N4)-methyltransferase
MAEQTKADYGHLPVLYDEVLALLQPQRGGRYIDGTVGAGGHAAGILVGSAPDGRLLGFDRDPQAIAVARERLSPFGDRAELVNASYATMGEVAPAMGFGAVDGILLDLGLSSRQLADAERGFSFLVEGPLDMRFDSREGESAADLINNLSAEELADIFWRYGEERRSRRIARLIVTHRPLTTTRELAELIASDIKRPSGPAGRRHPATQVFQALRIAVNDELATVERGLTAALGLLKPGGRLAVISFHSLEDRLVKNRFRDQSRTCVCPPQQPVCTCGGRAELELLTRKAVKASEQETELNPRSRSARLRVVARVS